LHGIALYASSENKILGNHIGVEEYGYKVKPNSKDGIYLEDSPNNRIGGTQKGFGNIISGNKEAGVRIIGQKASLNKVLGNLIGVGKHGISILQNEGNGIHIENAPDNRIGGTEKGSGNIISGNLGDGVKITGKHAQKNRVQRNHIGTGRDESAYFPIPNEGNGIHIKEAANNYIGGTEENAGNLISGNKLSGIFITGKAAKLNKIENNYIGTSGDAKSPLANEKNGVRIENAPENVIGGPHSGAENLIVDSERKAGNVISGNYDSNVFITGTTARLNRVEGNYIGTVDDGNSAMANPWHGVHIENAPENIIGGTHRGTGNLISGNYAGIHISGIKAKNNKVEGNIIGTGKDGKTILDLGPYNFMDEKRTTKIGNLYGVVIAASQNIIGSKKGRNIISGNSLGGIGITPEARRKAEYGGSTITLVPTTYDNKVFNNFVGVDISGKVSVPNGVLGIGIASSSNNYIGGAESGTGNVISGNEGPGIMIYNEPSLKEIGGNNNQGVPIDLIASKNRIQGNFIGTDEKGIINLGNEGHGVSIKSGDENIIGSDPEHDLMNRRREQNTIAYNGRAGVFISGAGNQINRNRIFDNAGVGVDIRGGRNRISRNRIFNNGNKGISLAGGVQPSGYESPILTSARTIASGKRVRIKGKFDQQPMISQSKITVEFFSSPKCKPTKEEGASYLGVAEVPIRKYYDFSFEPFRPVPKGHFITATAKAPSDNTSEFSNCVKVK
jgi:hypothetical protein